MSDLVAAEVVGEAVRDVVRDAVIIAAGRGTRMRPSTRVVPKEFLPNFDRPLLHGAIDEAIACGAERITIVTSDRSRPFLERYFAELAADEVDDPRMAGLRSVLEAVTVTWVEQPVAAGTGNATLYARESVAGRPFLLMLPDVVFPEEPAGIGLIEASARLGGSVISTTVVGREWYDGWGIVEGDEEGPGLLRLRTILEKPGQGYGPDSAPGINGRYVLTAGIFDAIEEVQRRGVTNRGEVNLTDAMVLLAEREPFFALEYGGRVFDSGFAIGALVAAVATALAREDLGAEVREQLRGLLGQG